MANFTGAERTNYFKVKNRKKFLHWIASHKLEHVERDGRFALFPRDWSDEGIFSLWDEKKEEPLYLSDELAKHLAPRSIAVIMGSGAEKLRHVSGWATAVNHRGEQVSINLDDIYDLAVKKFGVRPTDAAC